MPNSLFILSRAPERVAQSVVGTSPQGEASGPLGLDIDECRRFEDGVSSALAAKGFRALLIPHVYHLAPSHPAVEKVGESGDHLVVASWLPARPAEWALRAHGVAENRALRCFDMHVGESVEDCVAQLEAAAEGDAVAGGADEIADEAPARWYPVLDYSRCVNCKQCLEFCMFGVYTIEDEKVVATQPDNCKPGCPACARVCPKGAVMFPHYTKDPAIAGAAGATAVGQKIDVDEFFERGKEEAKEACPVCGCACDCDRSTDGTAPPGKTVCPACGCICDAAPDCACRAAQEERTACESSACACNRPGDELDDLIDALDKLDK